MPTLMMLNGLSATSVRLLIPYKGVWTADVDFDLEAIPVAPVGPAVLTIGTNALLGFIDPNGSGKFGAKGRARVLGGFGGWHKKIPAQDFQSDVGVLSAGVLAATAAAVGEKVVQAVPTILGLHYTRTAGAASRVLKGLDWHVDLLTGVTIVAPRVPVPVRPDTVEILEWDPLEQRATIATDEIVQPGSLLVDIRFGTAQVRDVEATFDTGGARVTAHCRPSALDIAGLLKSVAREAIRPEYLQPHTYRVVVQAADGRCILQSTTLLGPVPDMLPVEMCMGVPGIDSKLTPGTEVQVAFADGDPSKPLVVGFGKKSPPPIEVSCNAIRVAFGLGTEPVAKSVNVVAAIGALQAQFAALAVWVAANTTTAWTAAGLVTTATPLTTALTTGSTAVPAAAALIPSPRTFTD